MQICMRLSPMGQRLLELPAWSLADTAKGGRQLLVASRTEVRPLGAQTLLGHGETSLIELWRPTRSTLCPYTALIQSGFATIKLALGELLTCMTKLGACGPVA